MLIDLSLFCPQSLARYDARDKWIWVEGLTRLTVFTLHWCSLRHNPRSPLYIHGIHTATQNKMYSCYFLQLGKVTEFSSKSLCFKFEPGVCDFILSAYEIPSRNLYTFFCLPLLFIVSSCFFFHSHRFFLEVHHTCHSEAYFLSLFQISSFHVFINFL